MNKLVSRNSVQRFKEGKKIIKAQEGQIIYYTGRDGKKYEAWRGGNDWYYRERGTSGITPMPYNYITTKGQRFYESTPKGVVANSFETVNTRKLPQNQYIGKDGKVYQKNSDGTVTLINSKEQLESIYKRKFPRFWFYSKNPNTVTNTPSLQKITREPYFQSKYSNRANEIGGANKIIEWQRKIGTNPDGIWGADTERKYLAWLNRNGRGFKPSVDDFELQTELLTTPTTPPLTDTDIAEITGTPTYSTTPTSQFNVSGKNGTMYSNEHVRDLFDNVQLRTPTYKYATTFAKQGTKLVLRNPIERFKVNFRQVVQ